MHARPKSHFKHNVIVSPRSWRVTSVNSSPHLALLLPNALRDCACVHSSTLLTASERTALLTALL
jgi:hypothetical protein